MMNVSATTPYKTDTHNLKIFRHLYIMLSSIAEYCRYQWSSFKDILPKQLARLRQLTAKVTGTLVLFASQVNLLGTALGN